MLLQQSKAKETEDAAVPEPLEQETEQAPEAPEDEPEEEESSGEGEESYTSLDKDDEGKPIIRQPKVLTPRPLTPGGTVRKGLANSAGNEYRPLDSGKVLSTGCTLLDLAIAGGRVRGGGIPGGILVEIFGPSSSGKTAVAVEIGASAQFKGGEVAFADPEARLDRSYSETFGFAIDAANYCRPNTVLDKLNKKGEIVEDGLEAFLIDWAPANKSVINVQIADSIAALSTEMEMDARDKRGQRKAKELSELLRKTARIISQDHRLVIFTNQEKEGEYGGVTPGGKAVGFHASVRIRIARKETVDKEQKLASGVKVKKTIGILSTALIKKSSVDDEYRTAPIYVIFGHGIDDIRGNLQWVKDMTKSTKYNAVTKDFVAMDAAIAHIESEGLEEELRELVIDLWEEIEAKFKTERKPKRRF